jgi:hypothetical protein
MAIDDHPFQALDKQSKLEDSSVSPVVKLILRLAGLVPAGCWPFDKALEFLKERLNSDSDDRVKVMLGTCMNEVRKHDDELRAIRDTLSERQEKERAEAARDLLVDAARKAANTRSIERVKRIGIILANSVVQRNLDADGSEEMMRVATELSKNEVDYLHDLVTIEGDLLASAGRIARQEAHNRWERGPWGGGTNPELDSAFSKLASYGLVASVPPPNNLNIMADFQNRYVLLHKGLAFDLASKRAR